MTLNEFSARINQRLAAEEPPRHRAPADNDRLRIGDIVRYTPEYFRRVNGCLADVAGEVVAVNGKLIRVRWDDDSESSALDKNLECPAPPTLVDYDAFAEHQRQQVLLEIDRGILLGRAWH